MVRLVEVARCIANISSFKQLAFYFGGIVAPPLEKDDAAEFFK